MARLYCWLRFWRLAYLAPDHRLNIAGGVCGSLLAGFYLLRVYDMAIATDIAVALNLVVATVALLVAAKTDPARAADREAPSDQTAEDAGGSERASDRARWRPKDGRCVRGHRAVWVLRAGR